MANNNEEMPGNERRSSFAREFYATAGLDMDMGANYEQPPRNEIAGFDHYQEPLIAPAPAPMPVTNATANSSARNARNYNFLRGNQNVMNRQEG